MTQRLDKSVSAAVLGFLAGVAATVPMTMVMTRLHRRLPSPQQYALPPRIITDGIANRAPVPGGLVPRPGPERALAAHFLFGGATGALYGLLTSRLSIKPSVPSGVTYGLGVWAISYLGWVPAARLMPPATRQPAERNAMMIAAHVVWGSALAVSLACGARLSKSFVRTL